jgi:hypothetical protein
MNRKLKISLYLAALYVAGIATGLFISWQLARHFMPNRERMANHWCGELESKLNLTPEQLRKIRPIVDDALARFKENLSGEMLLSLSNCNARIRLELTPEQGTKFERIEKDQEEFIRTKIGGEAAAAPKK